MESPLPPEGKKIEPADVDWSKLGTVVPKPEFVVTKHRVWPDMGRSGDNNPWPGYNPLGSEEEDPYQMTKKKATKSKAEKKPVLTKQQQKDLKMRTKLAELLAKRPDIEERGVWRITGEDNSYGGVGDTPNKANLGLVRGTYRAACEYAVTLEKFFTWGHGGTVTPAERIPIKDLD